jgi:hypothetical protein
MSLSYSYCQAACFVCILAAATTEAQNLPSIPPTVDPNFWGHSHKPYILKLALTNISNEGTNPAHTRNSEENVSRDSTGRVRVEDFYDSGRPSVVSIRDPNRNTMTAMKLVDKSATVIPVPRPTTPPPGRGWEVERLSPRFIAGLPADGFKFKRTIPASPDGQRAEDTVVEEDWISSVLSVVLEQKVVSQRNGISVRTVTHYQQVEPDPSLFSIPRDYTLQQTPAAVSP